MLIIKSTGIILGLAVLLGTLSCVLQRTSAQNATGNVTNGHTENLVVQSDNSSANTPPEKVRASSELYDVFR